MHQFFLDHDKNHLLKHHCHETRKTKMCHQHTMCIYKVLLVHLQSATKSIFLILSVCFAVLILINNQSVKVCTFTSLFFPCFTKVYLINYFVVAIRKHGNDFSISFRFYCLLLLLILFYSTIMRTSRYIHPHMKSMPKGSLYNTSNGS